MLFIEQYFIKTAISGIQRIHRYPQKAGAARERFVFNADDAFRDDNTCQVGTVTERIAPNTDGVFRDGVEPCFR